MWARPQVLVRCPLRTADRETARHPRSRRWLQFPPRAKCRRCSSPSRLSPRRPIAGLLVFRLQCAQRRIDGCPRAGAMQPLRRAAPPPWPQAPGAYQRWSTRLPALSSRWRLWPPPLCGFTRRWSRSGKKRVRPDFCHRSAGFAKCVFKQLRGLPHDRLVLLGRHAAFAVSRGKHGRPPSATRARRGRGVTRERGAAGRGRGG